MRIRSVTGIIGSLVFSLVLCGHGAAADTHYQIVPGESELRVLVFRSGALSKLGHNHVVSTSELAGTVVTGETAANRKVDMHITVDSLVVDDPAVRDEEGQAFAAEVSEKDAASTRDNMLGPKLLQADRFEEIRVFSDNISGELPQLIIEAQISIRGQQHVVRLPVIVEMYDDRLVAFGRTDVAHSDLGLSPFKAGFGTLRVAETMTFEYRVVARQTDAEL